MFNYKIFLAFLFATLAISIGLQMIMPWPYGLIAALGLIIAFPLLLRRRMMRGVGGYDRGGIGGEFFGLNQDTAVKYSCLVCGNRFKGTTCPRCGSKMKKADF